MKSFLISFLLTALLTPGLILLAPRLGWVALPRTDRWHSRPTALMGGIAIFGGTVAAWLWHGDLRAVAPVALPAAGLFLLGVVDDRVRELRPHHRLMGQVAAAAALIAAGVTFHGLPPWIAMALTLFWVVGITNAVNLLDNMDGLAAGVTCIGALTLAVCCLAEGSAGSARALLALAGGCAGFLLYNFNPARIFMGDCGSMFIGFSLAALAIQGTQRSAPNLAVSLLVPVTVLAVPIFDTTLVTVTRTLHGRSISQGFRDHSSHRMVALGLSERVTVLTLYGVTALFGGLALLTSWLSLPTVLLLAVLLLTGLLVLGLYLGFLQVYPEESQVPPHLRQLGGRLLHKKQLLQVLLDIQLVPVAFVGAHLLRFEGELPPAVAKAVLAAIPSVLVAKLTGLALCRAHRGVWRYAGAADALTAIGGSAVGSVLAAGALGVVTGYAGLSRAALLIDWLLFTVLVVTVRTGYVMLRELFGMLPARNGPHLLILGAGTEACALVQKLRDPLSPGRATVSGILDDAPGHHGRRLNGVPVLGSLELLPSFLATGEITGCLLGVSPHSEEGKKVLQFCERQGIPVLRDLDSDATMPVAERFRAAA